MKRFHVHVAVPELSHAIRFYSNLFGADPAVVKPDYAKWMLDDPRVNFAISQRGAASGINHLGFQVESDAELQEIHSRLAKADADVFAEKDVACCYARSDKYWVKDPAGVPWESFRSLANVAFFDAPAEAEANKGDGCCATPEATPKGCCTPEEKERTACCA